jgi:short-subunit dehydrogenase
MGLYPTPRADGYTAGKHAMAGFFDSLRIELAPAGVSVTVVYPSWVTTGITTRALTEQGLPKGGEASIHEQGAMTVEECARITIKAAGRRKREVVMTALGKMGRFTRLVAPGFVDRVSAKMAH